MTTATRIADDVALNDSDADRGCRSWVLCRLGSGGSGLLRA